MTEHHSCDRETLEAIKKDITAMLILLKEREAASNDHEKRINFIEKLIFGTAAAVGLAFLGLLGTCVVWVIQHLPGGKT